MIADTRYQAHYQPGHARHAVHAMIPASTPFIASPDHAMRCLSCMPGMFDGNMCHMHRFVWTVYLVCPIPAACHSTRSLLAEELGQGRADSSEVGLHLHQVSQPAGQLPLLALRLRSQTADIMATQLCMAQHGHRHAGQQQP